MRKHGRKRERMEPDFSGPYTILSICGKFVTLRHSDGATLKNKYNINHLKPYRRGQTRDPASSVMVPQDGKKDIVFPDQMILPLFSEKFMTWHSVIHFATTSTTTPKEETFNTSKERKSSKRHVEREQEIRC